MEESLDAILARFEELRRTVADLQRRIAILEGAPLDRAQEVEPALAAAEAQVDTAIESIPGMLPLFGWALMGIAGAYLLRAVTESGGISGLAAAAAGVLYAALWLYLAARRAGEKPIYSTVHGVTAALILVPMLWEMTVRFHLLSAVTSSMLIVGFAMLGLAIGWRGNVNAIAWSVVPAAFLTAFGLFRETHDASLWAATLLAVALAVEVSSIGGHWRGLRWVTAILADLAVFWFAQLALRSGGSGDVLVPIDPIAVIAAQIALLAIYLGGTVYWTLVRGLNITWFEIAQTAIAFSIALSGVVRGTTSTGALAAGLFCLLCGVGCYLVSFAFHDRERQRERNFYAYSTFGGVLIAAGCAVLLSGAPLTSAWTLLALGLMLAGKRAGRDTLRVHAGVYLLLAVWHSELLQQATARLIRTGGEAVAGLPIEYAVTLIGAAACYGIVAFGRGQRTWVDSTETVASAALVVWGAAGAAATAICVYLSPAAPIRTALLTALSIAAAWSGLRWTRQEFTWLAYPLLALAGVKLLLEDLRQGQSALLVLSLVFFGGGLVLLPRLNRKLRPTGR